MVADQMHTIIPKEHFDLATRMRDDTDFRNVLTEHHRRMADLESIRVKSPMAYMEARDKIMFSIWKDCGRNLSMLVPYYFPKYPKDKPMSMQP